MNIKSINPDELSNVMRQYYDIKMKYLDEIILFQLGDFYEMFFEDAIIISKELELTLTSKKAGLKERIPMCGIPLSTLNDYLKKILDHSHTVVLVEQTANDSLGQKIVNRQVKQIISKGTYIKDSSDNNFLGSSAFENNIYYLSYGDIATGELYSLKTDNFIDIQTEIINQNIKEIVSDKSNSKEELESLILHGVSIREIITTKDYKTDIEIQNVSQRNLINYLNYTQVGKIDQFKFFQIIKLKKQMHMSANAQKQLELLKTVEDGEYKNSFLHFLNNTSTAMGKRLLKKYLTHPLVDLEEILTRQKIVDTYIKDPITLDDTQDLLKQIYDFERLIGKVIANNITPREIEKLKLSLKILPELYEITPNQVFTLEQVSSKNTLTDLYNYLESAIINEAPQIIKDGGFIKKGFNKEIDDLKKLKDNSNKWLIEFENKEQEKTGIKNLKVKYNKIFGYFIEVTNSNISQVPDYYIEKQTMTNCKRYITEELKVEENKILNAHDMLLKLEFEIYAQVKDKIKQNILELQQIALIVSTIDVLSSFAINAINHNLTKPIFNNQNIMDIKDGRHPIVENTTDNYIKNDLILEEQNILLITGPNMAGKSTYMRMVSLIVIMAQIGSYVPASFANLKIISSIFTRIGAGDNLSKAKSTFMVEMLETEEALKKADENSLLIFDELGRGTSTYDGISLAQAIINYISKNIKCKTLFSTHYHELVDMAKTNKDIKLVHVKASDEGDGLKFYHKVMPGSVSKSYGIEVASLAGLDPKIITEAKQNYILASAKISNVDKDDILRQIEEVEVSNDLQSMQTQLKKLKKYEQLLQIISTIDLNNLTPIQSLNQLAQIKDEYDKNK